MPIFVLLILTCLVTLLDRKLQVVKIQKLAKLTIFGIFDELFVNGEARFARNIEWDFFYDFQPPCAEIKDKTNHVYYGLTWTMMRHTRK